MRNHFLSILLFLFAASLLHANDTLVDRLAVKFDGHYGQLEIGGKFVGVEFHNSHPLPSRFSFYYPVANSIDLSTDYWQRYESQPLTITISFNGITEVIGKEPFSYQYTPFFAEFTKKKSAYQTTISYHFCDDLPAVVLKLQIRNLLNHEEQIRLLTQLKSSLRTCHSYSFKQKASIAYHNDRAIAIANFDDIETDSTQVFLVNVGEKPLQQSAIMENHFKNIENATIDFEYLKTLKPDAELTIIQIIGSCKQQESREIISRIFQNWEMSVHNNDNRILDYVWNQSRFDVNDINITQTARWSKAILASNKHFIDGHIVPMPCPAEYNFFFTHDVLQTDLGAILFDEERVKNDLQYLHTLTTPDSVLPHAYYWRDTGFQTEFCQSDNWNHLWFLLMTSSYLKHTDDKSTVELLYPMLKKSLEMMLQNKGSDDLMYAIRPDWWDIGDVYGARAYITILMIRALKEFCYINLRLGRDIDQLESYHVLAERMKQQLSHRLWDDDLGYLINMLDSTTVDKHYYAGSLLACAWNVLDEEKTTILLKTAKRQLLDENIGIHIVMPADFHQLIDVYKFKGMEAGEPYVYINGGIWPQGIVWYALGWLAIDKPNIALEALRKYLTLEGIANSPNGQPSFFEYRKADPQAPNYGEIDKPTFLWAGGWFLYALYHLAGVRENEWNISFDPQIPSDWRDIEFDMLILGSLARVSMGDSGQYFANIFFDGEPSYTAVLTEPVSSINLERGTPNEPYLAKANTIVCCVNFNKQDKRMEIAVEGVVGQRAKLEIISPYPIQKLTMASKEINDGVRGLANEKVWINNLDIVLCRYKETLILQF